jgi:subtilase family serine protease
VAGDAPVDFEINLKLPDQAGAEAFAKAVATPGNSSYHQYLTPTQWEARFAPSASAVNSVVAYLKANGFTVGQVPADRMNVPATGTVSQVEKTFGTLISYHSFQGQSVQLADQPLAVAANVASVVSGITGVNETLAHVAHSTGAPKLARLPRTRSARVRAARARATRAHAAATPDSAPIPQPPGFRVAPPCGAYYNQQLDAQLPPYGNGYPANPPWAVCGYVGPQFRSAYNLTGAADGRGVTVAIVDAYASPTLFSDAHHFAALNDPSHPLRAGQFSEVLPANYDKVNLCSASGWFGEQTLDVEAVHNTAPGANIIYSGAKNCTTKGLNDALQRIVDHHQADVITNSYGDNAGDLLDSAADRQSTDNILLMADGTGVSVLFSSGDGGDEYTTVGQVSPDYPASSPYATAVGGTTLQIGSNGQRIGEFGWSTARSFLCNSTYITLGGCTASQHGQWLPIDLSLDGGSGGGTSYVYQQPSYQAGVVPTSLSEVNGATPMRVVPDVSMEADPATGMLVGETQTFPNGTYYDQYRIGGTSVASPLLAGVIARANSQAGHALGFINPALYSLSGNSSAIADVLPAGKQDQSRSDYANSIDSSQGFLHTTRIIDYEGQEQYCTSTGACATRNVALNTAQGYDNMTGLGAPGPGFVGSLVAAGGH